MRTGTRISNLSSVRCGFLLAALFALLSGSFLSAADVSTNSAASSKQKGGETPEKLISQIAEYCLAGDSTNLLNCFDTSTKVHEIGAKSFTISIELAKAKVALRDALVKKFGAEKVAALKGTYVFPAGLDPLKKLSDSFQKPIVAIDGDTASVTFGSSEEIPLKLERKNKRWFMVRGLEGMAAADEEEAFDTMEGNRYYTMGVRDALKAVSEAKTIEEADKDITEAVNRKVGEFLARPVASETQQTK